jgi:alpha-tubulin suppressor-like RCC1 family protein
MKKQYVIQLLMFLLLCLFFLIPGNLFARTGDADSNGRIDIVDALIIAQYYVGMEPAGFNPTEADVNQDSNIDIVDALLVAQFYVGLIPELPLSPTPTPADTPIPTDIPPTQTPIAPLPPDRNVTFLYSETGSVYSKTVAIPNNTDTAFTLLKAELRPAEVMGFGSNVFHVLGIALDTDTINDIPLTVPVLEVADMEVALSVSFFLKKDGSLWGCGFNHTGLMGDGTDLDKPYPVELMDLGIEKVSTRGDHILILKTDGSLWVCGSNKSHALGYDSPTDFVLTPYQLMNSGVIDIAAGSRFSLAVKTDGSLWVWGRNSAGQLGTGNDDTDESYPVKVIGCGVVAAAAGSHHSFALKSDGSLWAAGEEVLYDEASGTYTKTSTFTRIIDSGVIKAVIGLDQSLALMNDGSLWGYMCENWSNMPGAGQAPGYPGWLIIETHAVADMDSSSPTTLWIKTDSSL